MKIPEGMEMNLSITKESNVVDWLKVLFALLVVIIHTHPLKNIVITSYSIHYTKLYEIVAVYFLDTRPTIRLYPVQAAYVIFLKAFKGIVDHPAVSRAT